MHQLFFIFCQILFLNSVASGAKVNGRIQSGLLAARETFSDSAAGSESNDLEIFSFRSFLEYSEIGQYRWVFTTDLRDKYDAFGTLNRERLKLEPNNDFQVQQMSFRQPIFKTSGWGYSVGRFAVSEAGGAFVDGVSILGRAAGKWEFGFFGGLNPKIVGQSSLTYNSNATNVGTYLRYQAEALGWNRSFYFDHALLEQKVDNVVDRRYLYHNLGYQWSQNSRVLSSLYLDMIPRTYLQQGNLSWRQEYLAWFYTKLGLLAVDAIEYAHIQNVREQLAAAPYKQGLFSIDFRFTPNLYWEVATLHGKRETDELSKSEVAMTLRQQRLFDSKWDAHWVLGHRNNFSSRDDFGRVVLGYYSNRWEVYLNVEAAVEKLIADQREIHSLATELTWSQFWTRALYSSFSFQKASDEQVDVYTGFFKLGYRYGSADIPPLRDGSPMKGAL